VPECGTEFRGMISGIPGIFFFPWNFWTLLKMLVMRFADVQWPAPKLSLHSMFKAQYKCHDIIIIIIVLQVFYDLMRLIRGKKEQSTNGSSGKKPNGTQSVGGKKKKCCILWEVQRVEQKHVFVFVRRQLSYAASSISILHIILREIMCHYYLNRCCRALLILLWYSFVSIFQRHKLV